MAAAMHWRQLHPMLFTSARQTATQSRYSFRRSACGAMRRCAGGAALLFSWILCMNHLTAVLVVGQELQWTPSAAARSKPAAAQLSLRAACCVMQGTTTMLLVSIPHFKDLLLASFECPECGFRCGASCLLQAAAGPFPPRHGRCGPLRSPVGGRPTITRA